MPLSDKSMSRIKSFVLKSDSSGYSKVKSALESLVELGYSINDIVLKLHEEFPEEIVDQVLEDCRKRGVI